MWLDTLQSLASQSATCRTARSQSVMTPSSIMLDVSRTTGTRPMSQSRMICAAREMESWGVTTSGLDVMIPCAFIGSSIRTHGDSCASYARVDLVATWTAKRLDNDLSSRHHGNVCVIDLLTSCSPARWWQPDCPRPRRRSRPRAPSRRRREGPREARGGNQAGRAAAHERRAPRFAGALRRRDHDAPGAPGRSGWTAGADQGRGGGHRTVPNTSAR